MTIYSQHFWFIALFNFLTFAFVRHSGSIFFPTMRNVCELIALLTLIALAQSAKFQKRQFTTAPDGSSSAVTSAAPSTTPAPSTDVTNSSAADSGVAVSGSVGDKSAAVSSSSQGKSVTVSGKASADSSGSSAAGQASNDKNSISASASKPAADQGDNSNAESEDLASTTTAPKSDSKGTTTKAAAKDATSTKSAVKPVGITETTSLDEEIDSGAAQPADMDASASSASGQVLNNKGSQPGYGSASATKSAPAIKKQEAAKLVSAAATGSVAKSVVLVSYSNADYESDRIAPPQNPDLLDALDKLRGKSGQDVKDYAELLANAVPGKDFPIYAEIPEPKSFSCSSVKQAGFYADTDTDCQVIRRCDTNGQLWSYLCPNLTRFSQITLICDWFWNIDCSQAKEFYDYSNSRLYHPHWVFLDTPKDRVDNSAMAAKDQPADKPAAASKPAAAKKSKT